MKFTGGLSAVFGAPVKRFYSRESRKRIIRKLNIFMHVATHKFNR